MTHLVWIRLSIESHGEGLDVLEAVNRALDNGDLQDALHDDDDLELTVLHTQAELDLSDGLHETSTGLSIVKP